MWVVIKVGEVEGEYHCWGDHVEGAPPPQTLLGGGQIGATAVEGYVAGSM